MVVRQQEGIMEHETVLPGGLVQVHTDPEKIGVGAGMGPTHLTVSPPLPDRIVDQTPEEEEEEE